MKNHPLEQARDIELARKLFELGARAQMVVTELPRLSKDKIHAIGKEINEECVAQGSMPFSTDWFVESTNNIHATLFALNLKLIKKKIQGVSRLESIIHAYTLYLDWVKSINTTAELSITRAWFLSKNLAGGTLKQTPCEICHADFVVDPLGQPGKFHCTLCTMDNRSGKSISLAWPAQYKN